MSKKERERVERLRRVLREYNESSRLLGEEEILFLEEVRSPRRR